jgi:hypothetical protein
MVNRRAVLSAFAVAVGAGAAGSLPAAAATGRFRRINVDVSPLRARGLGPYAAFVQTELSRALDAAFVGRIGERAAPDLTVRITGVTLSMWAGNDGGDGRWGFSGGGSTDYMEGEALVMEGRRLLLRHPQLSALPSSSGGAWYREDVDARRTVALCQHYASWLARTL